jgi:hypothetical protein
MNTANIMLETGTPVITASQFKVGDSVTFRATNQTTLHLAVHYIDEEYAYLNDLEEDYRISLRSSELRVFDKMGWTKVEGKFDSHLIGLAK